MCCDQSPGVHDMGQDLFAEADKAGGQGTTDGVTSPVTIEKGMVWSIIFVYFLHVSFPSFVFNPTILCNALSTAPRAGGQPKTPPCSQHLPSAGHGVCGEHPGCGHMAQSRVCAFCDCEGCVLGKPCGQEKVTQNHQGERERERRRGEGESGWGEGWAEGPSLQFLWFC